MPPKVGDKVGNYRIRRKLGSGGMGEVYLAEHPVIGKEVALKVVHQTLTSNREIIDRFLNEARSVSAIGNEHIVEIHDFGTTADGAPFFTMEYLEGRTVAEELRRTQKPLSIEMAMHVALQIAEGLMAAHVARIIHRDLKPDNIMLVRRSGDFDYVKILDFGVAKMLDTTQRLTGAGVVLGTPEYMAPEVVAGGKIDARADIYSFGALLFHMVTGRPPFIAPTVGKILAQHVAREAPTPRAFNLQISEDLEAIILRCLAKEPARRFATMDEVRISLTDVLPQESVGPKSRARRTVMVAGIGVAAAATGALFAFATKTPTQTHSAHLWNTADAAFTAIKPPVADASVATQRPAILEIRVDSEPTDALVTDENGRQLGTTPFTYRSSATSATEGEYMWGFSAPGHKATSHRFVPVSGMSLHVVLPALSPKRPLSRRGERRLGDNTMPPSF